MFRKSFLERRQRVNAIMSAPMFPAGPAHSGALLDMAQEHRRTAHNALKSYDRGQAWGRVTFKIHMKKAREYIRKVKQGGN